MGKIKLLRASAGSGKTYNLAYEYVRNVIINPFCYKHILAVTFTNKATKEMKTRILSEIDALVSGGGFMEPLISEMLFGEDRESNFNTIIKNAKKAQNLILHDYSNFSIMTIDRFFQKVFRAFIRELGLDSSYKIGLNNDYIIELAVDSLMSNFTKDPLLNQWVTEMIADKTEDGGVWAIKKEMKNLSKKIFDKEFDREFYISHSKEIREFFNTLKEMKTLYEEEIKQIAANFIEISSSNGFSIDSYSYKGSGFYNYVLKMAEGDFEDYGTRVSDAMNEESKFSKDKAMQPLISTLQPILKELCNKWDQHGRDLTTLSLILENHRYTVLLIDIAKSLEEICKANNLMLLSNSVKIITELINNNETPYIYEKIGSRYEVIMIDEFQDTSSEQWSNFIPLIKNAVSVTPENDTAVTIVGDIKQSMYRWRGGRWQLLYNEIPKQIPNTEIINVPLDTNWRSSSTIIKFNNAIISSLKYKINSHLNNLIANTTPLSSLFADQYNDITIKAYESVNQHIAEKNINYEGYIEFIRYDNTTEDNLSEMVRVIEDTQKRGYKAGEIAIIVRSKDDAAKIIQHLINYKKSDKAIKECSYEVVSKDGLLLKNSEIVKFIISCIELAINNQNPISLAIFNSYHNISPSTPLSNEHIELLESLNGRALCEVFEKIVQTFSLSHKKEDIAYLQAIHDKFIEFSKDYISDTTLFLEYFYSEGGKWGVHLSSAQDAILIDTIHSVKGLEFPVVIMPLCDWRMSPKNGNIFWAEASSSPYNSIGVTPVSFKKEMERSFFTESFLKEQILETIESLNIFYVGVTRAENELYMMTPNKSKHELRGHLESCFTTHDDIVTIDNSADGFRGIISENRYCFGTKNRRPIKKESSDITIFRDSYQSEDYTQRIALKLKSERYFGEEIHFKPKSLGIMMHKVFEKIDYIENVDKIINTLSSNGEISDAEIMLLRGKIERSFENPTIKNWFDNSWQVRNENNIILSTTSDELISYRPDRVITKRDSAIVIDYKFGEKNRSEYRNQILKYLELLKEMGYSNIEGFLWFFNNGIIEKITL